MKKFLIAVLGLLISANTVFAAKDYLCPKILLTKIGITKLDKGEAFKYPLEEGAILECYAKKVDGSIDDFTEYNDYFVMKDGNLYSNTMHKYYKPEKTHIMKKVDQAKLLGDNKTLKMYDPLWEPSIRHHMRTVKINTQTGEYYMKGTQDNWMWYRNITATGYCRVKPQ